MKNPKRAAVFLAIIGIILIGGAFIVNLAQYNSIFRELKAAEQMVVNIREEAVEVVSRANYQLLKMKEKSKYWEREWRHELNKAQRYLKWDMENQTAIENLKNIIATRGQEIRKYISENGTLWNIYQETVNSDKEKQQKLNEQKKTILRLQTDVASWKASYNLLLADLERANGRYFLQVIETQKAEKTVRGRTMLGVLAGFIGFILGGLVF